MDAVLRKSGSPHSLTATDARRNHSLDALRCIAVSLVFWGHIEPVLNFGWIGVPLFFAISGYVITNSLLAMKEARWTLRASLGRFYQRRAFRILPAYYAYLALVTVLALVLHQTAVFESLPYALTFTYNFHHAVKSYHWTNWLNHLWTLSVEEQFYLLFPFAAFTLTRKGLRTFVILVIVASPAVRWAVGEFVMAHQELFGRWEIVIDVVGFTQFDSFGFGALLALVPREWIRLCGRPWIVVLAIVCAIAAAAVVCGTADAAFYRPFLGERGWHYLWGYSALGIVSALSISAAIANPDRLFGPLTATMALIGECSYGIYLLHFMLQNFLEIALTNWHLIQFKVVFAVPLFVATILLCRLSYVRFEVPMMKLGRSLERR